MKKLSKIKLNQLSKVEEVELNNRAMQSLKGGKCGLGCVFTSDTKAIRSNTKADYCPAYGCS
ncbi:MAG: TIGR04149 family rSAM-modified RiPP [Cytophagaceae bacterium]|jgi:natural product precursor|nr:TIGR04149 family rSAM-modified RiPP [Cytophagaceae bacterium]